MPVHSSELRFEQLQRFQIEIVGRLVQHEHVRRPREQPRDQQAVAFAARQRLHRRSGPFGREEEVAQVAVHVTRLAVDDDGVVAIADGVEHRPLRIELLALLIVVRDLDVGAVAHAAAVGLDRAEQQAQQRSSCRRRWDR